MHNLFLVLLSLMVMGSIKSQTTLTTSFDFATAPATMPDGWITNTTANYSSGLADQTGGTSRAGKLQAQGHHFTVNFYDEPGNVTYNFKSYGTNNFMGTVVIEESINGTSWTTIDTYGNGSFGGNWTQFSSTPDPSSRYIRIRMSNKVSGTNAGLDNVTITENLTNAEEINVVFDDENVPQTTSIQFAQSVSTPLAVKLGIENNGLSSALTVGAASITGTASTDYVIASAPNSVSAQSSDTLEITFTPSQSGNRPAQISIPNSDANEDPYVIDLDGIGGLSASEPTQNPTTATTTYLRTWRVNGTVDNVGSDGYLTLMRRGQTVADAPVDGEVYTLGEDIGDSKVVGIGANPSFRIKSASADTKYHLAVFAYNGSGGLENYRTSDPLVSTITTPVASMEDPNYWQGIDETSNTLVNDLSTLINQHTVRFYSNYDEDMIPGFYGRDTVNGQQVVTGVYSSDHVLFTPPFEWVGTNMNREHTFPASWMPTAGSSNTPEYQDLHHLFPTVGIANSQRSNRPLGNVVNQTNSYGDGKVGTNSNGDPVYEPRDTQKGDAARAILYMMTAYSWNKAQLNSNGPNQGINLLIDWHFDDPPSGFERSRNDYIDSLQNNRNPFVDSIHWVCYIDFNTHTYKMEPDSLCLARAGVSLAPPVDTNDTNGGDDTTTAVQFLNTSQVSIYPNPAQNHLWITGAEGLDSYVIFNQLGQAIWSGRLQQKAKIDLFEMSNGLYFLHLEGDGRSTDKRFVISRNN